MSIAAVIVLAGCADFSTEPADETLQPSLSAAAMHVQEEPAFPIPTTPVPTSEGSPPSTPGAPTTSTDPCLPDDATIIAACLDAPWGLAVLPDGASALVGERTTGRILLVQPRTAPTLVIRIPGVDATGDGGLLGIALSPHYVEDGLIYAYVTTATDNRIIRIATGDVAKEIFTGIPKGAVHNGGRISFGADGSLYIATGDAGITGAGADPQSLAGKVLRIDEFGNPVPVDPVPTPPTTTTPAPPTDTRAPESAPGAVPGGDPLTAVFADGLVNPTGICQLGAGGVGVVDRVGAADVLTRVTAGADIRNSLPVWSFQLVDGGGVDCAQNDTMLAATSLDQQLVTALTLGANGGFSGLPQQLVKGTYGRLLTLESGAQGLLWATTSNKDGAGSPQPRDDMVVVIPTGGSAGGDGRD